MRLPFHVTLAVTLAVCPTLTAQRGTTTATINFPAPGGVYVSPGLTTAALFWQPVSGAPGYVVERMDAATATWRAIGPTPIAASPFEDSDGSLRPGRSYRYRVSVYGDGGYRSWSEVAFTTRAYGVNSETPYVSVVPISTTGTNQGNVGQVNRGIQITVPAITVPATTLRLTKGLAVDSMRCGGALCVVSPSANAWPVGTLVKLDIDAVASATREVLGSAHRDIQVPPWFAPLPLSATTAPATVRLSWQGDPEATGYAVYLIRGTSARSLNSLSPSTTSYDFVDPYAGTASAWLVPGAVLRFTVTASLPSAGTLYSPSGSAWVATRARSGTVDVRIP